MREIDWNVGEKDIVQTFIHREKEKYNNDGWNCYEWNSEIIFLLYKRPL